jgi:hypothetical protein
MGLESLVHLLVVLVIVGAFAWVVHWVIAHYLPEPMRTPAFVIAGAIFLIVLLVLFVRWAGVAGFKV